MTIWQPYYKFCIFIHPLKSEFTFINGIWTKVHDKNHSVIKYEIILRCIDHNRTTTADGGTRLYIKLNSLAGISGARTMTHVLMMIWFFMIQNDLFIDLPTSYDVWERDQKLCRICEFKGKKPIFGRMGVFYLTASKQTVECSTISLALVLIWRCDSETNLPTSFISVLVFDSQALQRLYDCSFPL